MSLKDDADTIARRHIHRHGEALSRERATKLVNEAKPGTWNHTIGQAVLRNLPDPVQVTQRSFELFMAYAKDAGNWSGTPLVAGNVGGSAQDRGNLTQLKVAGLIETFRSNGDTWIEFTPAGVALAAKNGITI